MGFNKIHQWVFWGLILISPIYLKSQTKYAIVEGSIRNYHLNKDTIETIEVYVDDFLKDELVVNSIIDSKGSFKLSFPLFGLQDVSLHYNKKTIKLLLGPGSKIEIEFESGNLTGPISFKGDFAALNLEVLKYERAKQALWKELYGPASTSRYNRLSDTRKAGLPEKFKTFIYDRLRVETDFYNNYVLQNNASEQFRLWAKADLEYEAAVQLVLYLLHHEKDKDKIFRANYFDFFDRFPLDNVEASITSRYIEYLDVYDNTYFLRYYNPSIKMPSISRIILEEPSLLSKKEIRRLEKISQKKESSFSILDALFLKKIMMAYEDHTIVMDKLEEAVFQKVLETYIKNSKGFLKDVLLSGFYYQLIQDGYLSFANKNIDLIRSNVRTAYFRDTIDSLLTAKNKKPEDYPLAIFPQDYSLPISKNDSIFHNITQQYKGKVLYIDFWGPWCAPCRAEMPHSKALWQNFKDKDVVFLYLGVESKKDVWKSTIAELKIPGEHYLLSNSEYAALKSKFQITGVPHYILIDKAGRIKDARAKAPSEKGLKKEIEDML